MMEETCSLDPKVEVDYCSLKATWSWTGEVYDVKTVDEPELEDADGSRDSSRDGRRGTRSTLKLPLRSAVVFLTRLRSPHRARLSCWTLVAAMTSRSASWISSCLPWHTSSSPVASEKEVSGLSASTVVFQG